MLRKKVKSHKIAKPGLDVELKRSHLSKSDFGYQMIELPGAIPYSLRVHTSNDPMNYDFIHLV